LKSTIRKGVPGFHLSRAGPFLGSLPFTTPRKAKQIEGCGDERHESGKDLPSALLCLLDDSLHGLGRVQEIIWPFSKRTLTRTRNVVLHAI